MQSMRPTTLAGVEVAMSSTVLEMLQYNRITAPSAALAVFAAPLLAAGAVVLWTARRTVRRSVPSHQVV